MIDGTRHRFPRFKTNHFCVLTGAANPVEFRPAVFRSNPLRPNRWVIGGLANKNPAPLIEALSGLLSKVALRLFGYDRHNLAQACGDLIAAGRLELTGVLERKKLSRFYREVDCVVMAEESGRCANLAAESMASGTPLVRTPHPTAASCAAPSWCSQITTRVLRAIGPVPLIAPQPRDLLHHLVLSLRACFIRYFVVVSYALLIGADGP